MKWKALEMEENHVSKTGPAGETVRINKAFSYPGIPYQLSKSAAHIELYYINTQIQIHIWIHIQIKRKNTNSHILVCWTALLVRSYFYISNINFQKHLIGTFTRIMQLPAYIGRALFLCESAKHGVLRIGLSLQFINNYNYSIYNNNCIYQNAGRLSLFERNGIFSNSKRVLKICSYHSNA